MRAQVSLEFIIIMGLAILLLVSFLAVGSHELASVAQDHRLNQIQDIGLTVQQELITAQAVSDGYSRTFNLPKTILNKPYTLQLENQSAVSVITIAIGTTQFSIRAPLCTGSLQPGENTITKTAGVLACT